MDKMKTCLAVLAVATLSNLYCYSQETKVYVAKYKDNKECAVSYTFDDGLAEQYSLAVPELEKRGFHGTFFINGAKVNNNPERLKDTTRVTWLQLKEMAQRGHEISNHGWAHRNLGKFPFDVIKEDIMKNDSAILVNVGVKALTYAYPNNTKPEGEAFEFSKQGRVGTRVKQRSVGSKWTLAELNKWVDKALAEGDWAVGMTHGITYGYDAFGDPERLWKHFDYVKSLEYKVWVGTFQEVAAYLAERDAVTCSIKEGKHSLTISPSIGLDEKLFTEPLTMVVETGDVQVKSVKQEGEKLEFSVTDGKAQFEFDPFGGEIIIKVK